MELIWPSILSAAHDLRLVDNCSPLDGNSNRGNLSSTLSPYLYRNLSFKLLVDISSSLLSACSSRIENWTFMNHVFFALLIPWYSLTACFYIYWTVKPMGAKKPNSALLKEKVNTFWYFFQWHGLKVGASISDSWLVYY